MYFIFNSKRLLLLTLSTLICAQVSAAPIRDIPSGHWAQNAVTEVVDYGFMKGDPNGNFGGNRALSRYEFAKTLSRMLEYFNTEMDSDRKDVENMVSIMEMFQKELKSMESKMSEVNSQTASQNETIDELNELVITLSEEFNTLDPALFGGQAQQQGGEVQSIQDRLLLAESKIDKLQHKGLFIDTIVKGTFNDVRNLGSATGRAIRGTRSSLQRRKERRLAEKAAEVVTENVSADVDFHPEEEIEADLEGVAGLEDDEDFDELEEIEELEELE